MAIMIIATILLAAFGIGYALWRTVLRARNTIPQQHSGSVRWRHVVALGVLSAMVGFAAAVMTASGVSSVGALGWWVAFSLINVADKSPGNSNLGMAIGLAWVVDAAICFAILWGGFLLWSRLRR